MTGSRAFRSGHPCSLRCAYCFAKSPEYVGEHVPPAIEPEPSNIPEILYPVCDSELQFNKQILPILSKRVASATKPLYVSISTKTRVSDATLLELADLNYFLGRRNLGFIKIAASASSFRRENTTLYEEGCAPFEKRLETLKRSRDLGLPVAVTIKPVLPQIETSEYLDLVDFAVDVVDFFLIGGLYCSEKTDFGRYAISRYSHLLTDRSVDWLPGHPIWKYIEDPVKMKAIEKRIRDNGAYPFSSDAALIYHIRDELDASRRVLNQMGA